MGAWRVANERQQCTLQQIQNEHKVMSMKLQANVDKNKEDEKAEFSNEVGKVKADMGRIQIESNSKGVEEKYENIVTLHTSIENEMKRERDLLENKYKLEISRLKSEMKEQGEKESLLISKKAESVVKDKEKELEEKEAVYKKNTKAIETKLSKALEVAKKFKDAAAVKDKSNKDSELSLNKTKEDKDKLTSEIKILRETLQKSTEKEQSSLKQITNANTKFEKESKAKQTEILKLTTEKDEVSSTLLQLREEKDSSALKYKDQLQDLKKVHDKDLKGKLNEQQSSYSSTINQLKKDLENKNDNSAKFVKLQEELKGSIETMSSMKTAHETELSKKVEEIKVTTASLREESNNSLEQKILLVVKDKDKELEEKEVIFGEKLKVLEQQHKIALVSSNNKLKSSTEESSRMNSVLQNRMAKHADDLKLYYDEKLNSAKIEADVSKKAFKADLLDKENSIP